MQGVEMQKHSGVTQIAAALDYVRMEYMHMIRVEELAQECHIGGTHFRRLFESCMGMSRWITSILSGFRRHAIC